MAPSRRFIQFPPAALSDFVVHYQRTDYHVSKFVLFHHSAYFRTYIEQLTAGQRAYPTDECNRHPRIPHCIRLPDRCGKLAANTSLFGLFLNHLHFAQHYQCFPYAVTTHISPNSQPEPAVTLDCVKYDSWAALRDSPSSQLPQSDGPLECYGVVLSLCHYFDCALLLSRAEHNMLLTVAACQPPLQAKRLKWDEPMQCLEVACNFGLQRLKEACMPVVAARYRRATNINENVAALASWEKYLQRLEKATLIELMRAISSIAP